MGRLLAGVLGAAMLASAAEPEAKLELRGRVTGAGRARMMRVTLFSVETPYTASTLTDPGGEFRFHSLPAGTYTLSVVRRSLGEIRRTVVITAGLADRKGTVRVTIPYSASEAAASRTGAIVSKRQLSIPERAWNQFQDAQKHLAKHDVAGAQRILEKAVAGTPQFSAALNSLGVIAYQTGDNAKAEDYFRQALAADPVSFEAVVNLGGVLLSLGRLEEALRYNEQAVAERPKDALANAQAGMTYFELGEFDRAEPALAAAERADPAHYSKPQLFLAQIYQHRGDREAARRELQDYVARHPDDAGTEGVRRQIRQLAER